MASIDLEVSNYVRDILKRQTDRDKQRKVGLSQLSDACSRCLGEVMVTGKGHQSKWNMGSINGTALHSYLEERNQDPYALKEFNGLVDVIPGYGEVKSTSDLYRINKKNLVDYKTSTRDKMDKYLRDWERDEPNSTIERYFRQAQGYAYMVEDEVEKVSICFVARDGQIVDRDVFAVSMPYHEEIAVGMLNRAKRLWAWFEANEYDWTQLNSAEDCFVCEKVRPILESQDEDMEL